VILAQVMGTVVSTRKDAALMSLKLLLVREVDGKFQATGNYVVAADAVGAGTGELVRIRVGLNSGEVLVRAIAGDLHMDYTAVGQTTHLAARMEQMAEPGTILATAGLAKLVEGYVQTRRRGERDIRGLTQPVEVYEVLGTVPLRTRVQIAERRGLSRFVGREAELAQLERALRLALQGRGQVVALAGEPGVGKSRLLLEFVRTEQRTQRQVMKALRKLYEKVNPEGHERVLLSDIKDMQEKN